MDRQEKRIHYGRQSARSESATSEHARTSRYESSRDVRPRPQPVEYNPAERNPTEYNPAERNPEERRLSSSTWYSKDSAETERARRYNRSESVWAEPEDARTRQAERQGTVQDARRTIQRHKNRYHRTQNRQTIYNTGGLQTDSDMFQAVAAEDRDRTGSRRAHEGINSHGTWRSNNGSDYPALRDHHRTDFLRLALPVVLLVLVVVAIVLGIRSCTGA